MIRIALASRRWIPADATIHQSVQQGRSANIGYNPPNLPAMITNVEPWVHWGETASAEAR